MITMLLRRSERLGISVMFFVFFFVWWRMVQGWSWIVAQDYKRCQEIPSKALWFWCFEIVHALICGLGV